MSAIAEQGMQAALHLRPPTLETAACAVPEGITSLVEGHGGCRFMSSVDLAEDSDWDVIRLNLYHATARNALFVLIQPRSIEDREAYSTHCGSQCTGS